MKCFLPICRNKSKRVNSTLFALFLILLSVQGFSQTSSWVGGVSTDYFNVNNWNPSSIAFNNIASTTLIIGPGNPYNPVQSGGSANTSYRPARLNTLTGSNFTVNGTLYPNGNDSLNGTITLNAPADFNIRNYVYIGNKSNATVTINGGALSSRFSIYMATGTGGSATVTVAGGSVNPAVDLILANTAGTTGQLNITGGAVNIPRYLTIGAGGKIFISGIGLLKIAGDKTSQLNGLMASGQLSCPAGKTLSINFDGVNTIASIYQNPNSMLREYPDSAVLNNGIISAQIQKSTGNIVSLKYKGIETLNQLGASRKGAYSDLTTSYGFETLGNCVFSVKTETDDVVDISLKRTYNTATGQFTPVDVDFHYVLNKGDTGLYAYSILEHPATYPAFDLGSWRQVLWIAQDSSNYLCEKIYADSLRNWQMPSVTDFANASATPIAEIVKLNTGVRAGKYDGKYEYSLPFWEMPVYGHASDVNHIGSWIVLGSQEYFNGGPTYHDLNAAAGILHVCMNGVHYNNKGFVVNQGEYWKKMYGPYLIYTSAEQTADQNWEAAQKRAATEKAKWPYSWLTDNAEYPLTNERGSVSGKFVINDPLKPNVTGANAWIGVTQLSNPDNQWQFEEKNYQYWVKTDASGNFTIPNIRPGTYTLFAYSDGAVGEYTQQNVVVTEGGVNNLGNITWTIPRNNGTLLWDIGIANRKSNEFKLGAFDYAEGFVEQKFRDTFPEVIEYNVLDSNWAEKIPYAHTKYPTEDFAPGNIWKWRINFTLPENITATGNAKLTIAYASNDHAQQWIYVNDENKLFTAYYPDNGGGNAFIRQSNYAKYSYKEILIPMSKLHAGKNTITLVMPSNSGFVSHLMYDYISLEADVPSLSLSTTTTNLKCNGGTDGSVALTFNGGTPGYMVKLGANGVYETQTSPFTFNNLTAGIDTVFVKDASGKELSEVVTIGQPAALNLALAETDAKNNGGSNGSITATFNGGTPGYMVKLNVDGTYATHTSPYIFDSVKAGVYTVYLKDNNGCETSQFITVGQPGIGSGWGNILTGTVILNTSDLINVYPNPSATYFIISVKGSFQYQLHDMTGAVIESGKGADTVQIGTNLQTGYYFLKIEVKGEIYVYKLIKL